MRVALIVNNPLRDLAGLVLLAHELASREAQVFLVPMALQRRELGALRPDFVLFNQLRPLNEPLARDLKNAGVAIGVLDDEGGVFSSLDWYGRQLASDETLRRAIDLFCSWGPKLAEHSARVGWYSAESIAVTGHPRFDFYAPQLRHIVLPGAPRAGEFGRPLVLINSRFSRANPAFSTPQEEVRMLVKSRGFLPEQAQAFQDKMTGAMDGLIELTNHLAARFPGVTFVFRPHPFEKIETYQERLKPQPNLHLNREGEIGGWLAISDAIIHRSCTTAIEAGMRDVPALSPSWIEMPEPISSTECVSIQYPTLDEIVDAISQLEKNELRRPEEITRAHEQVVQDWFGYADGLSHRRVADAIFACRRRSTPALNARALNAIFEGTKANRGVLARWRDRRKNSTRDEERTANWKQSQKAFDVEVVRSTHQAITRGSESTPTSASLRIALASEVGAYQRDFAGQSVAVLAAPSRSASSLESTSA